MTDRNIVKVFPLHITSEVEESLFRDGFAILEYDQNRRVQIFRWRNERYEFPSDRFISTIPRRMRSVADISEVRRMSALESTLQNVEL